MTTAFLVSTALMGALVLSVLAWVAKQRGWYHYSPATAIVPAGETIPGRAGSGSLADDPRALALAFGVLVVGSVGGVIAYVSGPVEQQATIGSAVALGAGGVLVGYLLFGIYVAATGRGHPRSLAVAESATVAGVLFLVAVTAQLLT